MRPAGSRLAAAGYGVVTFGVVVAPALLLAGTAARGGIAPTLHAGDLLAVSALVALVYSAFAYRRLGHQSSRAGARVNAWIAAVDGLVVLALLASLLPAAVLHGLGSLQRPVAALELPLLALWAALHVLAAAGAEATRQAVFRWLGAAGSPGG